MNARPGLNIQIANGVGLCHRISRIDEIYDVAASPATRAAVAREQFSSEAHPEPVPVSEAEPAALENVN
jgi:hypothetical protein